MSVQAAQTNIQGLSEDFAHIRHRGFTAEHAASFIVISSFNASGSCPMKKVNQGKCLKGAPEAHHNIAAFCGTAVDMMVAMHEKIQHESIRYGRESNGSRA